MPDPAPAHDEIDLWSYLEILLRGKWLIALVTAVAVGAAAVLSFFVLPPVYEARATLLVSAPPRASVPAIFFTIGSGEPIGRVSAPPGASVPAIPGLEKLNEVLAALAETPSVDLDGMAAQLTSPAILAQVAQRLNLAGPPESLAGRISVSRARGANTLEVVVTGQDPREAAAIANAVAEAYVELMAELSQAKLRTAAGILQAAIRDEAANLEQARLKLTDFLRAGPGLEELRGEFSRKVDLLTQYKARLISLQVEVASASAELAALERDLAEQPKLLTVQRALLDDPLLHAAEAERSETSSWAGAGLTVTAEEVNPVHVDLARRAALVRAQVQKLRAEQTAISGATARLAGETEALRLALTDRQAEYDLLQQRVDLHSDILRTLSDRYEETRVAQAAAAEALPISVLPAGVPRVPVGPRKLLNVTVAGMLGLMAGVMLVFLRSGWEAARTRLAAAPAAAKPGTWDP